ncbi:hypothetical protein O3M35_012829 [Rhynocoris fuscipes]|uniref:Cilia- and flagella-associated protein 69 ARM repeats domain-containing protein n=1 Tax=Rhynocoris fuscipes TaxID=488301 RepID=A0AAW1CI26_9HEMI
MFDSFYGDYCECCPHTDNSTLHSSTEVILHRICNVLLDDEGRTLMERQMMLFHHYFGLSKGELMIVDIKFIPLIMEYLCEYVKYDLQYTNPLLCFLYVCRDSPVMAKASELLIDHKNSLTNYFTSLGHCLILLDTLTDIQLVVLDIIDNLCSNECTQSERTIPYEIRKQSLEESKIATLLMKFLLIADNKLHSKILQIIHHIIVYSVKSCKKLLEQGYFEQLILFTQRIRSYRPVTVDRKQTILNILWHLLDIKESGLATNVKPLPVLVLSILDRWLRCEVMYGSANHRNDVLSLICKIIICYENLDLANSKILEDLFLLCAITEIDIADSWASNVRFAGTKENVQFKKILLTICAYSMKLPPARLMARCFFLMETLALHLNPLHPLSKTKWTDPQKWELTLYSLYVLPFFAPHFPDEYIIRGIRGKILLLIEYFSTKVDRSEIVCSCLKTLLILLLKHFIPIDNLREIRTFEIIFNLIKGNLNKTMSTLRQLILSYSFCIIGEICATCDIDPRYCCDIVIISKNTLSRFIKPHDTDFKIDESLIIATGSFLWSCIRYETIRQRCIQKGIIYLVLDIIESSSFPIQLLYTGMLADFAEDIYSVVPMVTWRGKHENMTVIPLLLKLWRTQEKMKGVRRGDKWSAVDSDSILKGKNQNKLKPEVCNCPPIIDMIACMRPKIYAIITLLLRKHYESLSKAENVYGIQQLCLSIEDEVTLKLIQYYEHIKKGEIFENILNYIKTEYNNIVPMFVDYLEMLVSKYKCWGVDIIDEQRFLIRNYTKKMMNEEAKLYVKLIECQREKEQTETYYLCREMYTSNLTFLTKTKLRYLQLLEEQRKIHGFEKGPNVHYTHDLNCYIKMEKCARHPLINSTIYTKQVLVKGEALSEMNTSCQ